MHRGETAQKMTFSIRHMSGIVGAQVPRDLGVTSIRNLTSSVRDIKGCPVSASRPYANERLEG